MLCIREALKWLRENQNISVSLFHCDDFFLFLSQRGKKLTLAAGPAKIDICFPLAAHILS